MRIKTIDIEGIPSWAICWFEYGYEADLPEEDIRLIRKWQKENPKLRYICEVESEGFNPYPAFGLACDTYLCKFEVVKRGNHD